ncbi:hypothetical protein C5D07_08535 [Rathayibacter tritici]|nr:LLM class flavin-dependent oxidoreductase [Rathayibacter tritici]PPI14597.1 hypothetical protein C5D07_08535 [Rathayibacter tritici]
MTEHYLGDYGGYCPSPMMFLSAVAAETQDIKLMTGGILPVFHHPIQIASQAGMLDALSDGRLELGFARGFLPYEYAAFQIPMSESRDRFWATVDAVRRLLSSEDVSISNKYWEFAHATTRPRPSGVDGIRSLVAASTSEETFVRAGAQGMGLMVSPGLTAPSPRLVEVYRKNFIPSGHDAAPRVVVSVPVLVSATDDEAVDASRTALDGYISATSRASESWAHLDEPVSFARYQDMGQWTARASSKAMMLSGAALVGSPSTVISQIVRLDKIYGGIDTLLLQVDYGNLNPVVAAMSIDLFSSEVVPAVLAEVAAPDHRVL